MSKFHEAVKTGDLKRLKTLKLKEINQRDPEGKTALFYASSHNHLDIVKYLLKLKADPNVLNHGNEDGPLLQASANGYTNVVAHLLQHRAAVNLADSENRSPLSRAAFHNSVDTVVCLIKHGADVNQIDKRKVSPVWWGASKGNLYIVTHLVQAGADVNIADEDQCTPILVASHEGYIDIVAYLCNHGADVNQTDETQNTPVWWGASRGHLDIVTYLVQAGANVNIANDKQCTPISVASQKGHVKIVSYLCKHGANVNQTDETKTSPLWWGASQGHLDTVEIVTHLVQAGANVNIADDEHWTPVSVASDKGHLEVVSYLCKHGAHLDIPHLDGRTSLFFACQQNRIDVVQCLLKHGADADIKSNIGNSTLHISSACGFKNIVKLLISHKVKISKNKNGNRPLDSAKLGQTQLLQDGVKRTDFDEIISMLEVYQEVHCDEVQQKQGNSGSKDAKNQIEIEKTESCIIDKDILQSPMLQNLAAQKAKYQEIDAVEMIRGKLNDENEYLKGLWAEINNVGKEIIEPKKVTEEKGLSDQQLLTLAKEMEQDWKMIGGFLGVKHSEIKELATEHKSEPTYAAWSMLVAWRDASGDGAQDASGDVSGVRESRQQLMSVLLQMGRQDIVDLM